MRSYSYCNFCKEMKDFEITEEETEYGKQFRKEHYGILPNGIGVNIKFQCMTCGNYRQ